MGDETELLNEEDCVAKTVVNVDIVDVDDNEIEDAEDVEDATVEDAANSSSVATEVSLFSTSEA